MRSEQAHDEALHVEREDVGRCGGGAVEADLAGKAYVVRPWRRVKPSTLARDSYPIRQAAKEGPRL